MEFTSIVTSHVAFRWCARLNHSAACILTSVAESSDPIAIEVPNHVASLLAQKSIGVAAFIMRIHATETADVHFGMTDAPKSHRKGEIRAADLDDVTEL